MSLEMNESPTIRCAEDFAKVGLPSHLHALAWEKVVNEIFDAGNFVVFGDCSDESSETASASSGGDTELLGGIRLENPPASSHENEVSGDDVRRPGMFSLHCKQSLGALSTVVLLDTMWITTFPTSRAQLREFPDLRLRLGAALGITPRDPIQVPASESSGAGASTEDMENDFIDRIWRGMWPHLICMSAQADEYSQFAALDEVGLAFSHSSQPNFRVLPITAITPRAITSEGGVEHVVMVKQPVAIAWPIADLEEGEMITRDYLQHHAISMSTDPSDNGAGITAELQQVTAHRRLLYSLLSIGLIQRENRGPVVERLLNYTHREFIQRMSSYHSASRSLVAVSEGDLVDHDCFGSTDKVVLPKVPLPLVSGWAPALNRLNHIKEHGEPLRIFMDQQQYLYGQLTHERDYRPASFVSKLDPHDEAANCPILLVDSPDRADVLYLIDHTYASGEVDGTGQECEHFKANKVLNQFWWDGLLVTKNMLARTMNRFFGVYNLGGADYKEMISGSMKLMDSTRLPCWFPPSYDLTVGIDLWAFIQQFIERERSGQTDGPVGMSENYWILKRNIGRMSVDYPISNELSCLMRHCEGALGQTHFTENEDADFGSRLVSRVASKYVMHPTTVLGKKFDVRFYLVVTSLVPLRIWRHEAFVIRLSNQEYSADQFEDFQKHFTLMSLLDDSSIGPIRKAGGRTNIVYPEFIQLFDGERKTSGVHQTVMGNVAAPRHASEEPSLVTWASHIVPRMHHAIATVFKAAQAAALSANAPLHPNAGWSLNQPNACPAMAVYGVDILLNQQLDPVVLEIQWSPDACKACEYRPSFWEDMMRALYLGGTRNMVPVYEDEFLKS